MMDTVRIVERWGMFALTLEGPREGNPFKDTQLWAEFTLGHRTVRVQGFYDGDGAYMVRFMPDAIGTWTYVTRSNAASLDGVSGSLECVANTGTNHGPVAVHNRFHFAYADGTPYVQMGTTCYAWTHQGDALEAQTLETLKSSPFNKMRMCVFPKAYDYNHNEPEFHAFERKADGSWDYERPNPAFFRHFEGRIAELMDLGIQADIILFHPYDRWGYMNMGHENDEAYLRYLLARISAYRNVWWSMANEWEFVTTRNERQWDDLFRVVLECDPYRHLCSIHHCNRMYDHHKPWITHVSVQHNAPVNIKGWREQYGKPVIDDECCYEGNINHGWGNISPERMTECFWEGTVAGGYVGHGETYMHPDDVLWWSKGGVLHGESAPRIAFLRDILEKAPVHGLDPIDMGWDLPCAGKAGEYHLIYFGHRRPSFKDIELPEGQFAVDVIDTWNMTVTPAGTFGSKFRLPLPGRSYMAIQIRRVG